MSYAILQKPPEKLPEAETTPLLGVTDARKPVDDQQTRGGSVQIVIWTVFFQSIGFTVTLPSMAFYVESLGVSTEFYGWIVAFYSVGQFLGSPVFGYWSNHAPARHSIIVSLFISAIGNTLYGFVGFLPKPGWMMLLSRWLVGFGAGNVSVCRAYASEASNIHNRASTMAKLSAAQGMGFVVGPILGYILTYCEFQIGSVAVNKYTSPGFLSAIFGIANTVFAGVLFQELIRKEKTSKQNVDAPTKNELIPMLVSIFLFFVVIAVFSVFETMITIVTKHDFGWSVKDNGILFISVGAISVVVFAIISTPPMKKKDDRRMMFFGTILQIIGLAFAATWDWPFRLQTHLTKLQFFIAAGFIGIGYPIASAYMFAIYSKVLNPSFQGTKMGWLTAGGSIARMVGPIWATKAFSVGGGELLFMGTDALVIVSLIILIIFYTRLGPHPSYGIVPAPMSINAADGK